MAYLLNCVVRVMLRDEAIVLPAEVEQCQGDPPPGIAGKVEDAKFTLTTTCSSLNLAIQAVRNALS